MKIVKDGNGYVVREYNPTRDLYRGSQLECDQYVKQHEVKDPRPRKHNVGDPVQRTTSSPTINKVTPGRITRVGLGYYLARFEGEPNDTRIPADLIDYFKP